MTVFVGTSGWQYDSWRGKFYPEKLPKSRWLEHYATRFRTVEVNNTFYRLPGPDTFADLLQLPPARAYIRLHHGRGLPPPCYGRGALRAWAQRLRKLWGSDADAYVFFNNDGRACAPRDAARFERLVARDQPAPKMAATSWGAATANCA